MAEAYNIKIDSEPFATNFWYAGVTDLLGKEYPFTVMMDDEGNTIQISWVDFPPTDDAEVLEIIENDIKGKF